MPLPSPHQHCFSILAADATEHATFSTLTWAASRSTRCVALKCGDSQLASQPFGAVIRICRLTARASPLCPQKSVTKSDGTTILSRERPAFLFQDFEVCLPPQFVAAARSCRFHVLFLRL